MELRRSVLVPYSVEGMFDLIEQAERYPQFLPWCTGATVLERSDEWVAARLEFTYLKVRFGLRTRNPKQRPDWLRVRLVEGPFKHFHADWTLTPVADRGCRIQFALSYEIADGAFDRLAAPAIDAVSRSMVDAFVKRAEETLTVLAPAPACSPGQALSSPTQSQPAAEPARDPAAIAIAGPDPSPPDAVQPLAPGPGPDA